MENFDNAWKRLTYLCKNKTGDINDAGNYRPASLATFMFLLLEHYTVSCISPFVATTDNQLLQKMVLKCVYFYSNR